jgi:hypothetical protein
MKLPQLIQRNVKLLCLTHFETFIVHPALKGIAIIIIIIIIINNEMGSACGTYGRQEKCIQGFGIDLRARGCFKDPGVDGRMILKRVFKKWDREAGNGMIWLRIGTRGGLL